MTVTRSGATKKYSENWAKAFSSSTKKKSAVKKADKKKSKAGKKSKAKK